MRTLSTKKFWKLIFTLQFFLGTTASAQTFKWDAEKPGANFYQIAASERARLQVKKQALINAGNPEALAEKYREEEAQFERWALIKKDLVKPDGTLYNPITGWYNALANPDFLQNASAARIAADPPWTSLGPLGTDILNNWASGAGVGRINVVRRNPSAPGTLFAGSAAGGLFKSIDLGSSWTPLTDAFAGLGVSDLVFDPVNNQIMHMATGDHDGRHINSTGIFKTIDGGTTWTQKLIFTLDQARTIAHIYVDPANNNTIFATSTFDIYRSTDQGETWASVYNTGSNDNFNDIVKVGSTFYASGLFGKLYSSTDGGITWATLYTLPPGGVAARIDFSYSPNTPAILYILKNTNPAFAQFNTATNTMSTFTDVTNSVPADGNGNYNSQGSYNQVIASNPFNGNELIVGEFSAKRSTNGGTLWANLFNGYYEPTDPNNWSTFYVHSDHHFIEYLTNDSVIVGNDGGVYIGKADGSAALKECFNGLVATQSYSISIFDAEPNHLMLGNQDNDGRSRYFNGSTSPWYAAQAGDGISSAIHRINKDIRFLSGTSGDLSYRTDGFVSGYSGTSITKPNAGVFAAPIEMHLTNGDILYGGFSDVYKRTSLGGTWVSLNASLGDKPKFIALANHPTDPLKQRIIAIGDNDVIKKTTDEVSWTTVTPPAGVIFKSIYLSKNSDTVIATANGYTAANKVFFSPDAGTTWTNITGNMINIKMENAIRYEGNDTVFLATELGVYFARLNPAGGLQVAGWAKFGTGLPNVRTTDMEISYTRKQLFISTFGRGVWMVALDVSVLAQNDLRFSYKTTAEKNVYSLLWSNPSATELQKTELQKSTDGNSYLTVQAFTDNRKNQMGGYAVTVVKPVEYYRLKYTVPTGGASYSQIIALRNDGTVKPLTVYPNPTANVINIQSSKIIKTVTFITVRGQIVTYSKPMNNFYSFDMSLLPSGIYYVKIQDADDVITTERVIRK